MIKYFRAIPYHFKTAFKSLWRHFAMTFSSSSAVSITLTLLMVFLIVAGNVSNFTYNIEDSLQIHATISEEVTEDQIKELQSKIESFTKVKKVEFSSKDQELENYIQQNDESSRSLYEMYRGEGNPLLNAFIIDVKAASDLAVVNNELNKMEEIAESAYGGDTANDMIEAMDGIRVGGSVFIIALSVLAVFLISNTIKSAIYARSSEIAIMRNIGATNGYIKRPFMIEGVVIGILGSIGPILITIFGYQYLYEALHGNFMLAMFELQPPLPFVYYVSGILLGTGILVGLVGSYLAATKYLRWKR